MDKSERKSEIGFLGIAAALAKQCIDKDGVVSVGPWYDNRRPHDITWKPGVFMWPWKFFELFGDDTEFEYVPDRYSGLQIVTEVNGIVYYATVTHSDVIENGRLQS